MKRAISKGHTSDTMRVRHLKKRMRREWDYLGHMHGWEGWNINNTGRGGPGDPTDATGLPGSP